jgi:MFS family permease
MNGDQPNSIRRLAVARVISSIGSWASGLALPFLLYKETGSGVWVGASWLITFGITGLLAPVAGAVADRFDRRTVMVVSDSLGAVAWGVIALTRPPGLLLALAFVATVVAQPFWAASGAAVPNLVPEEELTRANALLSGAASTASLVGPALAGLLIATFGARTTFAIDAVSFLVSAGIILTIRGRFSRGREETEESHRGLLAGFRFLLGDPVLRSLAIVWTMQYFAIDAALVADPPLVRLFGVGAIGYGILNSGWGLGALVGAFRARRLAERRYALAVAAGSVVTAVSYSLVAISPWFWPIVLLMAFVALADAYNTVAGTTITQRRTPDRIRGRTISSMAALGLVANAFAFTSAGFLVNVLGPRGVYALGAAAAIASFPFLPAVARNLSADVRPEEQE